ncbi:hypothetical protein CHISP_2277 [Chitinispirillum alkaliphilum]|nr:hypothetical protein CHISP_2277 [Chitinispirillum alkaliphilum]
MFVRKILFPLQYEKKREREKNTQMMDSLIRLADNKLSNVSLTSPVQLYQEYIQISRQENISVPERIEILAKSDTFRSRFFEAFFNNMPDTVLSQQSDYSIEVYGRHLRPAENYFWRRVPAPKWILYALAQTFGKDITGQRELVSFWEETTAIPQDFYQSYYIFDLCAPNPASRNLAWLFTVLLPNTDEYVDGIKWSTVYDKIFKDLARMNFLASKIVQNNEEKLIELYGGNTYYYNPELYIEIARILDSDTDGETLEKVGNTVRNFIAYYTGEPFCPYHTSVIHNVIEKIVYQFDNDWYERNSMRNWSLLN